MLSVRDDDFDLRALYDAIDEQRRARQLTWRDVAAGVSRSIRLRPVAASTITGLKQKAQCEGDGVLQMLLWLRRTPESFMRDLTDPQSLCFLQPNLAPGQILRWDTRALFDALDARRRERQLTWAEVAREIGGFTPARITNLSTGPRTTFPGVMRLVRWLGEPAAAFTRVADS